MTIKMRYPGPDASWWKMVKYLIYLEPDFKTLIIVLFKMSWKKIKELFYRN